MATRKPTLWCYEEDASCLLAKDRLQKELDQTDSIYSSDRRRKGLDSATGFLKTVAKDDEFVVILFNFFCPLLCSVCFG